MKNLMRKLKSRVGESLVESLAAMLIFTMASIVLFSMVSTAGDINTQAKQKDQQIQQQMVDVEKGITRSGGGTVTMTMDGDVIAQIPVDVYGGEDDSLFSYFVTTPTEGG